MNQETGDSGRHTYHSIIEQLENAAELREKGGDRKTNRIKGEGVCIVAFWLLVLATNVAGWYLLLHRFLPSIERRFHQ